MAKVIEIKTQNCPRCKSFEPEYQRIQQENPAHDYIALVFGKDSAAQELAENTIKSL